MVERLGDIAVLLGHGRECQQCMSNHLGIVGVFMFHGLVGNSGQGTPACLPVQIPDGHPEHGRKDGKVCTTRHHGLQPLDRILVLDAPDAIAAQDYLGVEREYYRPVDRGYEQELARRLKEIRSRLRQGRQEDSR